MTDLSKIKAEVGAYSSVVGNSVHLIAEDGRMIGQIAILCHTDDLRSEEAQKAICARIVKAFDLDALIADGVRAGLRMGAETVACECQCGPVSLEAKILSTDPDAIAAAVAAGPSLKAVRGSDAILAALRALAGEGE